MVDTPVSISPLLYAEILSKHGGSHIAKSTQRTSAASVPPHLADARRLDRSRYAIDDGEAGTTAPGRGGA